MTTSASTDFSITRDQIIKYALMKLGVIGELDTPTATQYTNCAMNLNMIVKSWQAQFAMPVWDLRIGYVLPFTGASSILVDSVAAAGGSHVVTTYTSTTLSAAAATSATALTVTSISGISASDVLGIELDDGSMHWTTVNGAPSGSTVTATTGLASAAASGNRVFSYTTTNRVKRPLRIIEAWRRDLGSNADVPMQTLTSNEYYDLGTKATVGHSPNQIYYDNQLVNPSIYVYPRFYGGDHILLFQYQKTFDDFDASGDTPDFPQEWYLPLVYELACTMAPDYGIGTETRLLLRKEADRWVGVVTSNNYEEGSVFFQPNITYRT